MPTSEPIPPAVHAKELITESFDVFARTPQLIPLRIGATALVGQDT
jgi:hypothetical protein